MRDPRARHSRFHNPQTYLDHAARLMLVGSGMICVGLGALGILLPGLPTTPFLLLAAYCFARSSERFHGWLLNHRWFGSYVRNFEEGRGMTRPAKATTLLFMWLSFGVTIILFVPVIVGQTAMFLLALGVTVYILRLPTPPESVSESVSESAPAPGAALDRTDRADEADRAP